jgi:hypothetical protein
MCAKRRQQDSVQAGDTFLVVPPYNHLYVVCSDPIADSTRVLLVSLTTFKPKEETCCIIKAGEHPFVKHRTCARYKDARIASVKEILILVGASQMAKREPVSAGLLARIRAGAAQSDYLPEECRKLLLEQSLIQALRDDD